MKPNFKDLTIDVILSVVRYEPETGAFRWASTVNRKGCGKGGHPHVAGELASRKAAKGYLGVTINGIPILCHRLAWFISTGVWPAADIDHENGNRADNKLKNLRPGSRSFNMQNLRRAHYDCASQLLGAYFDKRRDKWTSRICKDGKQKFLGYFNTAEAAANAYVKAKREIHEACTI